MTDLAQDFGLSDVALAKRCRKLGVPVPGRGYWARVAAGQAPRQTPLKKRPDAVTDYAALTFSAPSEEAPPVQADTAAPHPVRTAIEHLRITDIEDLRLASPVVKRTALRLKRPWRKEIRWSRGERNGPVIAIDVPDVCADRALRLSEQIIAGAASIGWAFKAPPKEEESRARRYGYENEQPETPVYGCLWVENEPLALRIDERSRRIEHELTEDEKARKRRGEYVYPPRWDYLPTGELRLHLMHANSTYVRKTWKDGSRLKLEHQVKAVLSALLDEALRTKDKREEQRLAEIERRRQEELRWEQSQRRTANATLIHELEAQAGAWLRARFLRSYLRALQRALNKGGVAGLVAKRQEETVDFLAWAQHYVDQLDPLCATPHDPDFETEHPGYYSPTDKQVDETLDRLLGNRWSDAYKIAESAPEPESFGASMLFDDRGATGSVVNPSTE
jgi:hypothetical protein